MVMTLQLKLHKLMFGWLLRGGGGLWKDGRALTSFFDTLIVIATYPNNMATSLKVKNVFNVKVLPQWCHACLSKLSCSVQLGTMVFILWLYVHRLKVWVKIFISTLKKTVSLFYFDCFEFQPFRVNGGRFKEQWSLIFDLYGHKWLTISLVLPLWNRVKQFLSCQKSEFRKKKSNSWFLFFPPIK